MALPPGSLQAYNWDPEIGVLRQRPSLTRGISEAPPHPPSLICVEALMVTENRQGVLAFQGGAGKTGVAL